MVMHACKSSNRRGKQEDQEFKVMPNSIAYLRPACIPADSVLKYKKKNKI